MWRENRLIELLDIEYPIIQAGMAGGPTTPELVAAVSNSGGLGTLGAGYMAPEAVREAIHAIRKLTDRPFGVNLFIPEPIDVDEAKIEQTNKRLDRYREELGAQQERPEAVSTEGPPFWEQLNVLVEERVPVFSCTFGVPPAEAVERLRSAGVVVLGTATTVREGGELEAAGVDAVVAQGSEAGGHRGTFAGGAGAGDGSDGARFDAGMVGTMALVPQLADKVSVPVVAAGGVMDGRGLAAALALGAEGAQMGTAFLTCEESGAHEKHREAVIGSTDESTVVTRAFSGKPARGIRNRMIDELEPYADEFPDYPIHNSLTKGIRSAAKRQNKPEYMSLWAGQAAGLSKRQSAAELVQDVVDETEHILSNLAVR
ncbi:MAG TPA: nitronate monooxygenase [Bacillales bacterium]|nr:nitronate monooxygenase [Bacillales bacterium]